MIYHPGSLALLSASEGSLALLVLAAPHAWRILRGWDPASSSEAQFALEKSTSLLSALSNWALGINLLSLFVFIATADDFGHVLAGAMCATGALNANPVGWWVLPVKGALLFGGGVWVCLNAVDNDFPDYPLVRFKSGLLLCILPLAASDLVLLATYLGGLEPDVITSCCGRLFSTGAGAAANSLASLDPKVMLKAFHTAALLLFLTGAGVLAGGGRRLTAVYSLSSLLFLAVALLSLVAFIAPHIYRMPTHHCPFDIFQRQYLYVGYPLTLLLAGGAVWGAMPLILLPFAGRGSIAREYDPLALKWVRRSLASWALFTGTAFYHLYFTGLSLY